MWNCGYLSAKKCLSSVLTLLCDRKFVLGNLPIHEKWSYYIENDCVCMHTACMRLCILINLQLNNVTYPCIAFTHFVRCGFVYVFVLCTSTYAEAEAKLGIAEEQYALETDSEAATAMPRNKRKKLYSHVESDGESSDGQRPVHAKPAKPAKVKQAVTGLHLMQLPTPRASLLSDKSRPESK